MKPKLATVQISFGGVLLSSISHNFHGCVDCERIIIFFNYALFLSGGRGAQWLSGRVLDSRPKGSGFEPHRRHCVVVLEQDTFILA